MWPGAKPLLFEKSSPGRTALSLPALDVPAAPLPTELIWAEVDLPELSELEAARHYLRLSQMNFCCQSNILSGNKTR